MKVAIPSSDAAYGELAARDQVVCELSQALNGESESGINQEKHQ